MADISKLNIGGSDYNIKDATARTSIDNSFGIVAYKETGNTASQAYSVVGTPINWKGNLYTLKTAVAKNATWTVGTNLTKVDNLGKLTSNIKTYVNGSGELVFRDLTGADTVLPFSGTTKQPGPISIKPYASYGTGWVLVIYNVSDIVDSGFASFTARNNASRALAVANFRYDTNTWNSLTLNTLYALDTSKTTLTFQIATTSGSADETDFSVVFS